jgi:hypothetical protein
MKKCKVLIFSRNVPCAAADAYPNLEKGKLLLVQPPTKYREATQTKAFKSYTKKHDQYS